MKTFLTSLETYLKNDTTLSYVKTIDTAKDWDELKEGPFPIINIEPSGQSFQKHKDFHYEEARQVKYKVLFSLAVRDKSYDVSVLGKKDINGILDLTEDFYSSIKGFETDNKRGANPVQIDHDDINVIQRTYKLNENGLFLATAELQIDFYITEFL